MWGLQSEEYIYKRLYKTKDSQRYSNEILDVTTYTQIVLSYE